MSYHSSFAKWLINNPNFIKQKIFFNLKKKYMAGIVKNIIQKILIL